MRLLFFILGIVFWSSVGANIVYMSPSGSDGNSGTIGSPKFSLEAAVAARGSSQDTIYVRGGTFQFTGEQDIISVSGHSTLYLKIWNYPGEAPIWTRSASYNPAVGVETDLIYWESCSYIWLKGIEISNYSQVSGEDYWFAFRGNDLSNCKFESINYHDNGSAFTLRGDGTTGNLFLNCDFYRNQDPYSSIPYDGADGLNITFVNNTSAVNTVKGCRAWWNADDGFDVWENEGLVIYDSCWSFWNGYIPGTFTTAGNGSGFKFGRADYTGTSSRRLVTRCIASSNRNWGFVENENIAAMQLYNNTAVHNGTLNWWFGDWGLGSAKTIANNVSMGGGCLYGDCVNYFSQIFGANSVLSTNSWQGFTVNNADFQSTDSTQLTGARSSGALPVLTYLKLVVGSDLVDASGTDYGYGNDLGALQYTAGGNISPSANAGTDQSINLPTSTVTLSGSGTDSDGSITGYAWTKISGTGGTIVSPSSASTSVTGLTAGTYIFMLTVTDNGSATGTDDIMVTVNPQFIIRAFKLNGKKIKK